MPHTVYLDAGDHWHVLADYSGSPRHAALPEETWTAEFSTDAAYEQTRSVYPGARTGITPRGIGRWSKDWARKAEGCCR